MLMHTHRIVPTVLLAVPLALGLGACVSVGPKVRGSLHAGDGTPIVWESVGKRAPAIVLIHCWCGNRSFWKNQVDELARDHEVVTFDLPGHGESGRARSTWTVDGLGADVAALCEQLDLEDVILVGHSMGGPVALCAAARMQGRVRGIIAVDTLHDADRGMTKEQIEPFAAGLERDFAAAMAGTIPAMLPPDADAALKQWLIDEAVKTDHAAAIALIRSFPTLDIQALLRNAGAPIRGINSAGSPWPTNVAANRKYADFDAVVMTGVGHYPHLERPGEFNEHLERWIAALSR